MERNQQSAEAIEKQKQFFERARKAVLQHLNDSGGMLNMAELHDYSMKKFLIQHQRFSLMMEGFVNEGLVSFDHASQDTMITDAGRKFIEKPA